jgi:hypothetical protein
VVAAGSTAAQLIGGIEHAFLLDAALALSATVAVVTRVGTRRTHQATPRTHVHHHLAGRLSRSA